MKRKYVVAGLAVVGSMAVAAPVLGGPSLSSLVEKEVAKQLSSAQSAKKVKRPRGPAGPAGATGATGGTGGTGGTGSPAASALIGRVENLAASSGLIVFAYPEGRTNTPISVASASVARFSSPNATIVLRDLFVRADGAPGSGVGRIYTLMNSNTGVLSCTISGTSQTTCDSGGAAATVAAGSPLSLRIENQGMPSGGTAEFGYRATTP